MSKKVSNIVKLVICAALVILGVVILCGGFTGDNSYAYPSNYSYDYGYATFGADFYNFVSNNAAYAAYNAGKAAARIADLTDLLENVFGFAFIAAGLLGICKFWVKEEKKIENNPVEISTEESVAEETAVVGEVSTEE